MHVRRNFKLDRAFIGIHAAVKLVLPVQERFGPGVVRREFTLRAERERADVVVVEITAVVADDPNHFAAVRRHFDVALSAVIIALERQNRPGIRRQETGGHQSQRNHDGDRTLRDG